MGTEPSKNTLCLGLFESLAGAQYNLGAMYANGQGVEQSFTTAKTWFQKSAAQGDEDAIAALKQVDEDIRRITTTSTWSSRTQKETNGTSLSLDPSDSTLCITINLTTLCTGTESVPTPGGCQINKRFINNSGEDFFEKV